MESIYYVLCWHCHRRCKHCYEDRFRPYIRDELEDVVAEAERNSKAIIANLPETMLYDDLESPIASSPGSYERKLGRIIISGGDVLTEPVRERVLYPTLEAIRDKYQRHGGVKVVVQTTGDLLTPEILQQLLDRNVWSVSISGMDDYHVGMQGSKRETLIAELKSMFAQAGVQPAGLQMERRSKAKDEGPVYSMFGATEETWVGKLWPRGRAWSNGLSKATMEDNFCNAWSGGLNFLNWGQSGSEVSIDPSGDVYPCCLKTAHPLGNLVDESLFEIIDSLKNNPAIEAINAGKPERMGEGYGWSEQQFVEACQTTDSKGNDYANQCIGCDRFFTEVFAPVLDKLQQQRRHRRLSVLASSAG